MLISIIIPVYNVEDYLEQCLESIVNQTYKDLEIIIINDGSTDNSLSICQNFATKDTRVKVINKDNEGQGICRNLGIKLATGDYVTFVDSDDYYDIDAIEQLVLGLSKSSDLVIGGYKKVLDTGEITYVEKYNAGICSYSLEQFQLRFLGDLPDKQDSVKGTVWNSLYKRSILQKNHVTFLSERSIFSEDTVFNLDYIAHCQSVCLIDSTAYNYRLNLESTSTKYDEDKLAKVNDYYIFLCNRFENNETAILRSQRFYLFAVKKCLQQVVNKPTAKSFKAMSNEIKQITSDSVVSEVLKQYPITKLDRKTYLMLWLVKHQWTTILTFLIRYSLGRNKNYIKRIQTLETSKKLFL